MAQYQLQVPLIDFKAGLKSVRPLAKRAPRLRAGRASLEFDGRYAVITCPGVAVTMNGQGEWPGRAIYPLSLLIGLLAVPPTEPVVTIRTDTQRIWFGNTSIACEWQPAIIEDGETFLSLPEPLDHLDMLRMLAKYGRNSLYAQGFQRQLRTAKAWRHKRVLKALEILAELGVSYDELNHLVDEALLRAAVSRSD